MRRYVRAKIHGLRVTTSALRYHGSVGIDEDVLNTRNDTTLDSFLLEGQFRFGGY